MPINPQFGQRLLSRFRPRPQVAPGGASGGGGLGTQPPSSPAQSPSITGQVGDTQQAIIQALAQQTPTLPQIQFTGGGRGGLQGRRQEQGAGQMPRPQVPGHSFGPGINPGLPNLDAIIAGLQDTTSFFGR